MKENEKSYLIFGLVLGIVCPMMFVFIGLLGGKIIEGITIGTITGSIIMFTGLCLYGVVRLSKRWEKH